MKCTECAKHIPWPNTKSIRQAVMDHYKKEHPGVLDKKDTKKKV